MLTLANTTNCGPQPQPVSSSKDASPLECHVNCTLPAANCSVAHRCRQWLLQTLVLKFSLHLTSCARHFKWWLASTGGPPTCNQLWSVIAALHISSSERFESRLNEVSEVNKYKVILQSLLSEEQWTGWVVSQSLIEPQSQLEIITLPDTTSLLYSDRVYKLSVPIKGILLN